MKKIAFILSLMIVMPAMADDWNDDYAYADTSVKTTARDNYVGIRLHKNEHIAYKYDLKHGQDITTKDDNFGFGVMVGNRLTDHVKIEFETSYTGTSFKKYNVNYDYDIWANMLNVYLFNEFGNAVAPYAGVGMGLTGIWAHANHTSDSECAVSYQAMIGVNFALNDRIDLNLGVKYQNYGTVEHKNSNGNFATTKIDATEFYLGAAYKFGL